jgi:glycosyltransferase involved in cell wall biosynthesis
MKLTILVVCFNEKATILEAIKAAKEVNLDKEIIVIDNYSTDGTRQILEGLKDDPSLKIIIHSQNMGGGYSTREAIRLAQGDYFYSPGADLEYKMEDACKMIEKIENEGLDAVLGSRLLGKQDVSVYQLIKERPFWLGSIISTFLINLFYCKRFTDIIGSNLVKTDVLRILNCQSNGVGFTFESVSKLCKNKYKIGEIPVWYKPRGFKEGKTVRAWDMIPALWVIFRIKFLFRKVKIHG